MCHCVQPSVFTETWPVARKKHFCIECRREIRPGTRYQYIKGIWDGSPRTYKTCGECNERRRDSTDDDGCWPRFGDLYEETPKEERPQGEVCA